MLIRENESKKPSQSKRRYDGPSGLGKRNFKISRNGNFVLDECDSSQGKAMAQSKSSRVLPKIQDKVFRQAASQSPSR